jgi:hypothetical protein
MSPEEQLRRTGWTQGGFEAKPEDYPELYSAIQKAYGDEHGRA